MHYLYTSFCVFPFVICVFVFLPHGVMGRWLICECGISLSYPLFCGSFVFFVCLVVAMPLCASDNMCLVVTCWERAALLALVCGVLLLVCHFPIGIMGQVWYLIVSLIFEPLFT